MGKMKYLQIQYKNNELTKKELAIYTKLQKERKINNYGKTTIK